MDGVKACMHLYTQYTILKAMKQLQPYKTILKPTLSFLLNA